ncbi:uncharacterized protein [Littorina saxatilis]|uniref:uncharacterized protein n=1 Tax=Littorina saxatilis TaxID=31220 RepID=UPI0038B54750
MTLQLILAVQKTPESLSEALVFVTGAIGLDLYLFTQYIYAVLKRLGAASFHCKSNDRTTGPVCMRRKSATLEVEASFGSARFEFPSLDTNLTLEAFDNSHVNLRFKIVDDCPKSSTPRKHYVDVYRPRDVKGTVCVKFTGGTCSSLNPSCYCDDDSGVFSDNVSMGDGGVWVWRTGGKLPQPVKITFDILALPEPTTNDKHNATSTATPAFDSETSTPSVDDGDGDDEVSPMNPADHAYGSETYTTEDDVNDVVTQKDPAIDGDGNDEGGTTKKKEHDEEDKDGGLHSSIITGVVVAGANVATIIVVGVVIGVCRRRRRRTRSRSSVCYSRDIKKRVASLPIPPTVVVDDIMLRNRCIDPLPVRSTSDGCQMADRIYEEIPALLGVPNEERISVGYTNAVYQARRT